MTGEVSGADLSYLRDSHPHIVRPHLSVLIPNVLFCGQISNSPAFGATDIQVSIVSGDIGSIGADRTIYVGTSCGDYSIAKVRYRSKYFDAAWYLKVAENSIKWETGQYITVVQDRNLWGVWPYIDKDTYVFYKDRDVTYTDENEEPPPVAIMGSHKAKFLDGPTVTFDLDASDSYQVAAGLATIDYLWECSTALSIGDDTAAITTITFDSFGAHEIKLTVTDANGKTQSTYRFYFVHSRDGANAPIDDFEISNPFSYSWSDGGWEVSLQLRNYATKDDIPDNALIVIWSEQWFNGVETYIRYDTNVLFCGYVRGETINKEVDTGYVTFDAHTIHGVMKNVRMASVSLEYNAAPDTWYKMAYLTVARAVHHYWRWHSTLFEICDVYLPINDTNMLYAVDDFEEGNLYEVPDAFTYQHSIFNHISCNKFGQLYVEKDIQMYDEATRAAYPYTFLMTAEDRSGATPPDIGIVRDPQNRVGYILIDGMSFDGTNNLPVISQAPGYLPGNYGDGTSTFTRLVLSNQAEGNFVVGRLYAIANRDIVEVRIPLAGNYYHAIDGVPQEWILVDMAANENKRGLVFDEKRFVPRSITADLNIETGIISMELVLEPEAFGWDGVPGEYPTGNPWPDWTFEWPELPIWPPWWIEIDISFQEMAPLSIQSGGAVYSKYNEWCPETSTAGIPAAPLVDLAHDETGSYAIPTTIHGDYLYFATRNTTPQKMYEYHIPTGVLKSLDLYRGGSILRWGWIAERQLLWFTPRAFADDPDDSEVWLIDFNDDTTTMLYHTDWDAETSAPAGYPSGYSSGVGFYRMLPVINEDGDPVAVMWGWWYAEDLAGDYSVWVLNVCFYNVNTDVATYKQYVFPQPVTTSEASDFWDYWGWDIVGGNIVWVCGYAYNDPIGSFYYSRMSVIMIDPNLMTINEHYWDSGVEWDMYGWNCAGYPDGNKIHFDLYDYDGVNAWAITECDLDTGIFTHRYETVEFGGDYHPTPCRGNVKTYWVMPGTGVIYDPVTWLSKGTMVVPATGGIWFDSNLCQMVEDHGGTYAWIYDPDVNRLKKYQIGAGQVYFITPVGMSISGSQYVRVELHDNVFVMVKNDSNHWYIYVVD